MAHKLPTIGSSDGTKTIITKPAVLMAFFSKAGHLVNKLQTLAVLMALFSKKVPKKCHAKFLAGHLNELGLLIGPNKSGSLLNKAARFVWANQEA